MALFAVSVESLFLADPPGLESLTCRGKRFPHVARTLVVHSIRPQTGEALRYGFPVFCVTLAGDSPPAGDLLSCFAKKGGKEGDPASPVGLRPTPLRCSQRAAGAELALRAQTAAPEGPARCSAARRFRRAFTHTEPLLIQGWARTVDHPHFRSPLTCRLEVMTGGKRASHV